jgi:hypothetical protein
MQKIFFLRSLHRNEEMLQDRLYLEHVSMVNLSEDAAENSYQKKNHNNNNSCSQTISIVRIQTESEIDNQPCPPPDTTEGEDLESACTEAKMDASEPENGFVSPEIDDKECTNGETLGVLNTKQYKVGQAGPLCNFGLWYILNDRISWQCNAVLRIWIRDPVSF